MTILDQLKKTIELLKSENCTFALAGGILVSAFRDDIRATNDIDLFFVKVIHLMSNILEERF